MTSTNTMLRLSTFCLLLAVVAAQSGYEYNKPGQPFGQGTSPSRPGHQGSGYPSSTPSSYPSGSPDEYPSTGAGTTPNYPSGPSTYDRPLSGYPGQNYPGQSPSGPSGQTYPGQYPSGPSGQTYPGQGHAAPSGPSYPGQSGSNYPSQNYPGQGQTLGHPSGFAPGVGPAGSGFDNGHYEGGDYSAIPGEPEKDYPILAYVPQTSFRCNAQRYPGYYADVETRCQAFHVCANNITYDFLCPNGTIFSQEFFVCVWWNQFDCNSAESLYELNANIYDYSIIGSSGHGHDHGPSGYPGQSTNYPDNFGTQGPSSAYPGSGIPQGTTPSYQGNTGPQGSYPGSGPSNYPSGPGQRPSTSYPGNSGLHGSSQGNYPGYQSTPSYPGSRPTENQGYPSGRPSGPGFHTGTTSPQSPSNTVYPAQSPSREYLPPRN